MGLFSRTLSRLEELKKALTRDPASRQFLALADEYRRQGQVREAIGVLERGLAQNPSAVAGHVALGRLLQQGGRLDEAIASFGEALRLDPQNLVALRQTADVHLSRGETVEAIKKLKLFRGLSPGDREVNELIRQLDGELAAAAAPRPPLRPERETPPPPAPEFRTGGIPVQRAPVAPAAPPQSRPVPSLPDRPALARSARRARGGAFVGPGVPAPIEPSPLEDRGAPGAVCSARSDSVPRISGPGGLARRRAPGPGPLRRAPLSSAWRRRLRLR
ncbi:MAG: tetratricopeptide repeat protein [Holophagales bacterium]|nr:tetratricopeptide repeat protein [Holophagales bacterium]